MSTIARGNAAEAYVIATLASAGLPVYIPFGGGTSADLLVVLPDQRILQVQVKASRIRNGCVEFNSSSTDHGRGQQSYLGRVDLIAVHSDALHQVFVLPIEDCAPYRGYLRLGPTANNQRRRVRYASDHTFDRWLASIGVEAERAAAA